jgi:ubiquinone biosynthesis protein
MEYIDGVPISDKAQLKKRGYSLEKLASIGLRCIFQQVFDFGFFHADPHPGNLIAVRKKGKPAIALIDFGIVGFVDDELRGQIMSLFMGMADGDAEEMSNAIIAINDRGPNCDAEGFRKAVAARLAEWRGSTVGEGSATLMLYNVIIEAPNYGVKISANCVLMAKAFLTIEGTAIWLNPGMDFTKDMRPLIVNYQRKQLSPSKLKQRVARNAQRLSELAEQLPLIAQSIESQIKKGRIEVHMDPRELLDAESVYDLETSKRNLAFLMGALFIATVLAAGIAPHASFAGLGLPVWLLLGLLIAAILYLRARSKIHKYLRTPV